MKAPVRWHLSVVVVSDNNSAWRLEQAPAHVLGLLSVKVELAAGFLDRGLGTARQPHYRIATLVVVAQHILGALIEARHRALYTGRIGPACIHAHTSAASSRLGSCGWSLRSLPGCMQ